jgi:catechol 2,3-dioxygenase-like lactoylglutathione lyase family enzyme
MKLEVVVVPVADVDRAKDFYKALGWREDADYAAGEDFRGASSSSSPISTRSGPSWPRTASCCRRSRPACRAGDRP